MLGQSNQSPSAFHRIPLVARHALVIVVVLLVAACSGGGCSSGCSSCGMTPLVRPIAATDIIQNAGAVRLTRSGLDFIAASAPTLAGKFLGSSLGEYQYEFNSTSTSFSVPVVGNVTVNICPGGPNETSNPEQCTVDVELSQAVFHVDAVTPDAISVSGTIPVRLEDLPISVPAGILGNLNADISLGSNTSCGPPNANYQAFPFTLTLPLVEDTIPPRVGYTKIDAANIAMNVDVSSGNVNICACGGVFAPICDAVLNGVKNLAFSTLSGTIESTLTNTVAAQLCTKPTNGVCPAGSTLDAGSGNCDYTAKAGTCLPIELGVDGLLNLGALLQTISYGASSQVDVALAAGGTMIPANAPTSLTGSPADNAGYTGHTPNGVTLGLLGALLPDPDSACVPQAPNPIPTGIPIPVELEQNTVTPWAATDPPGPQLGLALAGRYLNYALGSLYNSGTLCLGITTSSYAQLNSGLLSVLAPSIKDLTFEQNSAAAAVITRPQAPPTIVIGNGTNPNTDPLLMLTLKQFALDFYIWSDDRFVRAFTYTADLTIPINLSTAVTMSNPTGELVVTLGTVKAANDSVTNSELLTDDPTKMATGLTALIGTIVGQVAGAIKPVSLASLTASLGVTFTIPGDGIRKLTSGSDTFLALFGNLTIPPGGLTAKPQVNLVSTNVDPSVMTLTTFDPVKGPSLHVTFSATATPGAELEYSYWIDQGTRSLWSKDTDVVIQNQTLFLQGHHTLFVSAREVGRPFTESTEPASVPYLIDVLPPTITLTETATGATLSGWDYVSDQDHLLARTRITNGAGVTQPWSDWQPLASLATIQASAPGGSIGVEVRDEAGNVASSETALIRGQDDAPAVASACGCSTPGTRTSLGGRETMLLLLAGLGLVFGIRRVRRSPAREASAPLDQRRQPARSARPTAFRFAAPTALGVGVVVGALSQGCSCGSNGGTSTDGGNQAEGGKADAGKDTGVHRNEAGLTGCGSDCNQPCLPALPEGIIGAYTSIAKDSSGTIWVAGYDDSAVTMEYSGLYGDLVVGKYDSSKQLVDWTEVDGMPAPMKGVCPAYDPTGWRSGLTASPTEADVGLWTSIQLDASDHPIVSYYDATNSALKFASSSNGTTWKSHTVMSAPNSDIGRYSKMLVVNGVPVIAFLIMEPGDSGKMRSKVELATGTKATPGAASDWTFEDAAVDDDGPCRSKYCASPGICVKETGTCSQPSSGCGGGGGDAGDAGGGAACASGLVCVGGFDAGPSCGTPLSSNYIDIYPNAFGDYITMAPTSQTTNGVGIVVYDRIHGALIQLAKINGGWMEVVLDSETGARAPNPGPDGGITPYETGDVGVGASLFITSGGDWHVSYVNGTTEALQYILVPGGIHQPGKPEVVDTGAFLNSEPYPDGVHIVGDDSSIQVDSTGNVTISYQDATAGTLHVATGMPNATGGTHTWAVLAASQPNKFAGYFSHSIVGTTSSFANFWRTADPHTGDMSGDVSFVGP